MAGNNKVEIVVETVDKATAGLDAVRAKLGSIKLGLGSLLAVGGVSVSLAGLFTKFLRESSEAEQALSRFNLAFQNMGHGTGVAKREMIDFAATIQRTTKYTDEAVLEAQAVLFRFGSLTGETFKRARADIVDVAAALGADLSTAASTVGRALENPAQGMRMLRSLGVVLSASQQALVKDLMETGRQGEAQALILTEMEKRYKGAAEAAGNTLAGALAKVKNAFGELFEDPDAMKPMTEAMNQLSATLQNPALKESIGTLLSGMAKLAQYAITFAAAVTHMFSAGASEADAFQGRIEQIQNLLAAGGKGGPSVMGQQRKDLEAELALLVRKQQLLLGIGEAGAQADAAARARARGLSGPSTRTTGALGPLLAAPDTGLSEEAKKAAAAAAKAWDDAVKEMQSSTRTQLEQVEGEFRDKQSAIQTLLSKGLITSDVAQARGAEAAAAYVDGLQGALNKGLPDFGQITEAFNVEREQIRATLEAGLIDADAAAALGERAGKAYAEALKTAVSALLPDISAELEAAMDGVKIDIPPIKVTIDDEDVYRARAGVDAFVDALSTGLQNAAQQGKLSFKDLVRFVISQLLSQALTNAIKGFGDSLKAAMNPSGGGSSGWMGAIGNAIGSIFGMSGGGFAAGGMLAAAGGMTMVGEEGPELVSLPKGSRVYSNSQSKQMAAPVVNFSPVSNIAIVASDKDAQTLRQEFAAAIARNNQVQSKQMTELLNRNGFGRMR